MSPFLTGTREVVERTRRMVDFSSSTFMDSFARWLRARWRLTVIAASLGAVAVTAASCGYFVSPRGVALTESAPAPDFALLDHRNEKVTLASLLERGPAVVVFYRGFW